MQIIKALKTEYADAVAEAVKVLKAGGLVVYPTETCYGVAVAATNAQAVKKLLEYKRRPEGKAISIAVADKAMAEKYVELNETATNIYDKFLPGPITVISEDKGIVAAGLASEFGTLGVRIPDNGLALAIIKELAEPITATSANVSGRKTPYAVQDILDNVTSRQKDLIDIILDAGELPHNPPSTVIDTTKEALKILRHGDINLGRLITTETITSEEAMQQQGSELIKNYKNILAEKAILIMFNADLGAGKTQFIKGVARELEIKDIVNSPTFILLKEYDHNYNNIQGKLIHLDAWRLESLAEMNEFDLTQYFKPGNVIAVEWAGIAKEYLESISARDDVAKIYIEIEYKTLAERTLRIYE
jgi:L-threonylcarbamoyladenylate synthase